MSYFFTGNLRVFFYWKLIASAQSTSPELEADIEDQDIPEPAYETTTPEDAPSLPVISEQTNSVPESTKDRVSDIQESTESFDVLITSPERVSRFAVGDRVLIKNAELKKYHKKPLKLARFVKPSIIIELNKKQAKVAPNKRKAQVDLEKNSSKRQKTGRQIQVKQKLLQ